MSIAERTNLILEQDLKIKKQNLQNDAEPDSQSIFISCTKSKLQNNVIETDSLIFT